MQLKPRHLGSALAKLRGVDHEHFITCAETKDPAESVPDKLEHLPDSAWPYGLIVMVSDAGIVSSSNVQPGIQANRAKLLKILKAHGIAVDLWPSA